MSLQFTRRRILGTASLAVGATAGCLGDDIQSKNGGQSETTTPGTGDSRTSRTDSTDGNDGRSDDIYLDNETDSERVVSVTITGDGDGATDSDGTPFEQQYRIPAKTRVQITDVGEVEKLYEVVVTVDDQLEKEFMWRILSCADDEGSDGNTDVEIDLFEDHLRFRKNECDLIAIEQEALAQNASKYRV